ncbi:50S ribosomal protein L11 methyltransferase [Dactylosporangium sp. CA-092794]|uniref:50S ribosomal protein L11 methyltransferase n=1 Tax=Dactylosporangium sp. CA-092794 TaxID=3239929 RepID=UPI003D8DF9FD
MAPTESTGTELKAATDKPFNTYEVQACLYDEERVHLLRAAIEQTVKPGDVVVDAGSGTGLLGLFAAKAGAARVYCVELNPEFVEVIQENAVRNGLSDRIIVVPADAVTYVPPEPIDVIISEVISAGFFYEPQLQILGNLSRFLREGGRVVPASMNNDVGLIAAQDEIYGLRMNFDARFQDLAGDEPMTTSESYLATDFAAPAGPGIDGEATVRALRSGAANALRISYSIVFAPGIESDKPTDFLMNPQIIYLAEPVELQAGTTYRIRLRYEASESPLQCAIDITAASDAERLNDLVVAA